MEPWTDEELSRCTDIRLEAAYKDLRLEYELLKDLTRSFALAICQVYGPKHVDIEAALDWMKREHVTR